MNTVITFPQGDNLDWRRVSKGLKDTLKKAGVAETAAGTAAKRFIAEYRSFEQVMADRLMSVEIEIPRPPTNDAERDLVLAAARDAGSKVRGITSQTYLEVRLKAVLEGLGVDPEVIERNSP